MVGSGWLFAALAGASYAGPASLISWIIAAVLFIFIGLAYAELGSMLPFSGSLVRIDHYAHGSISNYLLGWAYLIGAATTVAMEAEAIIMYTNKYLPVFSSASGYLTPIGIAAAAALIAVFTLIQIVGVNVFSKVNTAIMIWKFIIPSLTIILLLSLYFHPSNFTAYGGFMPLGWSAVFSAMIPSGIVWAYEGFRQALEYAGEARNPHHDVPLALIISILVTAGLYVALEAAFIGGINWSKIFLQDNQGKYTILIKPGGWQNLAQSNWAGSPFYTELATSGIALLMVFAVILLIDAWISPAGTMGVYIGTTARSFYGFSRQGYFPELFGSLHKRFQTPWFSIIFTLVLALLFLLPFPTWYQIVSISSTATVVNYLAGGSSLVVLRRTAPELRRSYRVRSPWLIGLLSFTASSMLIYLTGWPSLGYVFIVTAFGLPLMVLGYRGKLSLSVKEGALFSLIYWTALASVMYLGLIESMLSFAIYWGIFAVIMIASLLYLHYKAKGSYAALEVSSASWFVGYMIVIGALSYLGSLGMGYLKYPWDYVLALATSIIFFIISVMQGFETRELTEIKAKGIPIE